MKIASHCVLCPKKNYFCLLYQPLNTSLAQRDRCVTNHTLFETVPKVQRLRATFSWNCALQQCAKWGEPRLASGRKPERVKKAWPIRVCVRDTSRPTENRHRRALMQSILTEHWSFPGTMTVTKFFQNRTVSCFAGITCIWIAKVSKFGSPRNLFRSKDFRQILIIPLYFMYVFELWLCFEVV